MSRPRVPSYYAFSAPRVSASVSSARASAKSFLRRARVPHHVADACDDDEQARADAADVEAEAELFRPARRFTHGEINT